MSHIDNTLSGVTGFDYYKYDIAACNVGEHKTQNNSWQNFKYDACSRVA